MTQTSSSGAGSASLGPVAFPGQSTLHPAILQFLFGQLGQAQQPQGQTQGAPQGQQLAQPVPLSLPFMTPIYQAFMQVSGVQSLHADRTYPVLPPHTALTWIGHYTQSNHNLL